jgi:hypothetical protein
MRIFLLLLVGWIAGNCSVQSSAQTAGAPSPLAAAEALIDAFYSFDPVRLRSALVSAPKSAPQILYSQGWAQGGNYVVKERKPCRLEKPEEVLCDITVKDDLIGALRTGYDVTDTFHLSFKDRRVVGVRTSSNDPPDFKQAFDWLIKARPEIMKGPCTGFFAGGPTPQDCVRAIVKGFAEYMASRAVSPSTPTGTER